MMKFVTLDCKLIYNRIFISKVPPVTKLNRTSFTTMYPESQISNLIEHVNETKNKTIEKFQI